MEIDFISDLELFKQVIAGLNIAIYRVKIYIIKIYHFIYLFYLCTDYYSDSFNNGFIITMK